MTTKTKRHTLLEISDELRALDDLLMEIDGDITDPLVEAYVTELFDEYGDAFDHKVDNYARLIRENELRVAMAKEEAERLVMKRKSIENKNKWLKERLMFVLQERGMKSAGKLFTATVTNNGGLQPITMKTDDPMAVPIEFTKQPPREFDMQFIRESLATGSELGFATLEDRGTHLRVK